MKLYKLSWLLLFVLLTTSFIQAQTKITLMNETSQEPVAFADVIFNNQPTYGTITDIDGNFTYDTKNVHTLTISFIGYETKKLNTADIKGSIITLKEAVNTLEEVVLSPDENPALAIMRKVIANKDLNNPENLNSFDYKSYNKIIVSPLSNDSIMKDTLNKYFGDKYIFISETVSKRKYLKPNMVEDSVIATRLSGFNKPLFALLATDFQPFSFYNTYFELAGTSFLNPISNGSLSKYDFYLEDELHKANDTIYAISFKPKKNRNFEGLKGILYINANKYAVQNIEATPAEDLMIGIKIQQQYHYIEDRYWFPEQLNFELSINAGSEDLAIKYTGKSYLTEVHTDVPLKKKNFAFESNVFDRNLATKDSLYWATQRIDTLSFKERNTYRFLDSLGNKHNFDRVFTLTSSLIKGRFPLKYVDVDLTKLFNYNKYEKLRLGAGFYTNDDLIKNVSVGGYAGYGFGDHTWKYGLEANTKVPLKKGDLSFALKYQNDLTEVSVLPLAQKRMYNSLGLLAERMDHHETYSLETNMKLIRNFYWKFSLNKSKVTPTYTYSFNNNGTYITQYHNTSVNADLTYYVKEKVTNFFGQKIRTPGTEPVINLSYSRGLKEVFDGDLTYNKLKLSIDHTFRMRNLGTTTYRIEGGYIDTPLPYGLLFTGDGVYDKKIPVVIPRYFQTLRPYEFVTDRYASLFTSHNFGGLLFKTGKFQPGIILHNNIGIGDLKNPELHNGITFETKDKVFMETGLEINNILKLNYLNVAYLGFGAGVFYRYGDYALPDSKDNFAFKISYSYSFK